MKMSWQWLNGKKTAIAAVANLVMVYVAGRDLLQPDTIGLITGLLGIWTGVAITHKAIKAKKP